MTELSADRASEDNDVTPTAVVTRKDEATFGGVKVGYTTAAGRTPIYAPDGAIDAQMFYVAYTRDGAPPNTRPLVFFTNGGPGAATAWLHIGGLGPHRIVMRDDGTTPPPPARLAHNEDCAIDQADLVFIDAVGTGFSRAANKSAKKRFFNRQGDLESYVAFIFDYLRANQRWASPIYLFGESYGAMRVAALSDLLVRHGVPVSGIVLMSSALDFHLLSPGVTNPTPYALALPSFATVALHHGLIEAPRGEGAALRDEVERWAQETYLPALLKGRRLEADDRDRIVAGLVRYTGLSEAVIRAENLRIDVPVFMKFALADKGLVVGRTDGRIAGPPVFDRVEEPYYDPAMGAMTPAFSSAAHQVLGETLKTPLDLPYRMYSRDVASAFELGPAPTFGADGYPQSLSALQAAMAKNPAFRVLSLQGLYDLAAPYWASEYGLDQLPLPDDAAKRITHVRLAGGHMSYADSAARAQIGERFRAFLAEGRSS